MSYFKEIIDADLSFANKIIYLIHSSETILSESFFRFWLGINGGKFERREASNPNACILVTKRSSHLFAGSLNYFQPLLKPFAFVFWGAKSSLYGESKERRINFGFISLNPAEFEAFELNCPKGTSFGQKQTIYKDHSQKNEDCVFCGRCLEVMEGDTKIIGGF